MASSSHRQKWWLQYSTDVSPFPIYKDTTIYIYIYIGTTHGLLYFYWTFSIGGKFDLGAAQDWWSWTYENMSGSSTFHINLMRSLLVHVPVLGHLMLRGKRESDYLDQVKIANFILEIKSCNLLPFPSHRGIWKQASTRTDKIHRSHRKSLLGPRKIVLITTCIKYKRLE